MAGEWLRISDRAKYALKAVSNFHKQGDKPNIFLFATARGGSTWVMEILASQPGMKYYDEPFNVRRDNVARTGLFTKWEDLVPDTDNPALIISYLNGLVSGEYPYMNPPPFRPHHRVLTDRVVFKIHEMEHLIGRIAKDCRGQVLYLLRHPVPTTHSRTVFPRLQLFLSSRYYDDIIKNEKRLREIKRLGAEGSKLQQGVVSWCYENLIPLQRPESSGLIVSYEELVLNPERSCDLLLREFDLDDRESMLKAFNTPAANIKMSSAERLAELAKSDRHDRAISLVTKWQAKLSAEERAHVQEILDLFELDVYSADRPLAASRFLHFGDTALRLGESSAATRA